MASRGATKEVQEIARQSYESENISFRGLSARYGCSHTYWQSLAKKEGWKKYIPPFVPTVIERENLENIETPTEPLSLLTPLALRKIEEIKNELGDLYSSLDEQLMMMYVLAYQRSLRLEKIVQKEGEVIYTDKGTPYFSPWYSALLASNKEMHLIGRDFGMSVVSRTKNSLNFGQKNNEPDFFAQIHKILNSDN
jgi:P27 family predicted phage terminase small subunit